MLQIGRAAAAALEQDGLLALVFCLLAVIYDCFDGSIENGRPAVVAAAATTTRSENKEEEIGQKVAKCITINWPTDSNPRSRNADGITRTQIGSVASARAPASGN